MALLTTSEGLNEGDRADRAVVAHSGEALNNRWKLERDFIYATIRHNFHQRKYSICENPYRDYNANDQTISYFWQTTDKFIDIVTIVSY